MKTLLPIIISIPIYYLLRIILYLVEGIIGRNNFYITLCLYFVISYGFVYGIYWYFEEYKGVVIITSLIVVISRLYWFVSLFKRLHDPIHKVALDVTFKNANEQLGTNYSPDSLPSVMLRHAGYTLSFGIGVVIAWITYFI